MSPRPSSDAVSGDLRAIGVGSRPYLDLEAVGLDRQRLLQNHLITRMIDQLETLQDHAERERGLMHRKAAPDTGALAVAERLPGVAGPPASASREKLSGLNASGWGPQALGSRCSAKREDGNEGALLQIVFAADRLVLQRRNAEGRRRRPQPQRLLEDLRGCRSVAKRSDRSAWHRCRAPSTRSTSSYAFASTSGCLTAHRANSTAVRSSSRGPRSEMS